MGKTCTKQLILPPPNESTVADRPASAGISTARAMSRNSHNAASVADTATPSFLSGRGRRYLHNHGGEVVLESRQSSETLAATTAANGLHQISSLGTSSSALLGCDVSGARNLATSDPDDSFGVLIEGVESKEGTRQEKDQGKEILVNQGREKDKDGDDRPLSIMSPYEAPSGGKDRWKSGKLWSRRASTDHGGISGGRNSQYHRDPRHSIHRRGSSSAIDFDPGQIGSPAIDKSSAELAGHCSAKRGRSQSTATERQQIVSVPLGGYGHEYHRPESELAFIGGESGGGPGYLHSVIHHGNGSNSGKGSTAGITTIVLPAPTGNSSSTPAWAVTDPFSISSEPIHDQYNQELRPPYMLRSPIAQVPTPFAFFVHIYGFRVKHQPSGAGTGEPGTRERSRTSSRRSVLSYHHRNGTVPEYCVTIDWDQGYFLRRTDRALPDSGGQISFPNSFTFGWDTKALEDLARKKLVLRVYRLQAYAKKPELLGAVEVDLWTLVTGPVHTDLPIAHIQPRSDQASASAHGGKPVRHGVSWSSEAQVFSGPGVCDARLQFNARVQQICELIVTPVEVTAYIEAAAAEPASTGNGPPQPAPAMLGLPAAGGITGCPWPSRSKSAEELGRVFGTTLADPEGTGGDNQPTSSQGDTEEHRDDDNEFETTTDEEGISYGRGEGVCSLDQLSPESDSQDGQALAPTAGSLDGERLLVEPEGIAPPRNKGSVIGERTASAEAVGHIEFADIISGDDSTAAANVTNRMRLSDRCPSTRDRPTSPGSARSRRRHNSKARRRSVEEQRTHGETAGANSTSATGDEERDEKIELSAAGGHQRDDEKKPPLARWQLEYGPTGLAADVVCTSIVSELTANPTWCAIPDPPSASTQQQLGSWLPTSNGVGAVAAGGGQPRRLVIQRSVSHDLVVLTESPIHGLANDTPASSIKSPNPVVPVGRPGVSESVQGHRMAAVGFGVANGASLAPSNADKSGTASATTAATIIDRGAAKAAGPKPRIERLSTITDNSELILTEIAPKQALYRDIATKCRRGAAIGTYIDNVSLPSCYLVITGDALRHGFFHVKLWACPLGVGPTKLFGEAWVPFSKLYNTDVVETTHRFFYDAKFNESLWLEGRLVGRIEGVIVLQGNPQIRQMLAGVHTELGFSRSAMPILGELADLPGRHRVPKGILQLSRLQNHLPACLLTTKNQPLDHAKVRQVTGEIVVLLLGPNPNVFKAAFVYNDLAALVVGQKVLLSLLKQVLELADSVPWHLRGSFGAMLRAFMRRTELDIGTVLPRAPACASAYPEFSLPQLARIARRLEQKELGPRCAGTTGDGDGAAGTSPFQQQPSPLRAALHARRWQLSFDRTAHGGGDVGTTGRQGRTRRSSWQAGSGLRCGDAPPRTYGRASARPILTPQSAPPSDHDETGDIHEASLSPHSEIPGWSSLSDATDLGGGSPIPSGRIIEIKENGDSHDTEPSTTCQEYTQWPPRSHHHANEALRTAERCSGPSEDHSAGPRRITAHVRRAGSENAIHHLDGDQVYGSKSVTSAATLELTKEDIAELLMYHSRMKVARAYVEILEQLKHYCLEQICSEALFESQRRDVCYYMALLYHRLPEFRKELLAAALSSEERHAILPGAKAHDVPMDAEALDRCDGWRQSSDPGLYELQISFDWQPLHDAVASYFGTSKSSIDGSGLSRGLGDSSSFVAASSTTIAGGESANGALGLNGSSSIPNVPLAVGQKAEGAPTASVAVCSGIPRPSLSTSPGVPSEATVSNWQGKFSQPRGVLYFKFLECWGRLVWRTIQFQRRRPISPMGHVNGVGANGAGAADGQGVGGANSRSQLAMEGIDNDNFDDDVRWDLLPGYATILKAFLIEMRTRPVAKFPDALLNCSGALLVNDRLLSVFVRIVMSRTSVYSREQVFAVFNYLDFWFDALTVVGRPVPQSFDYRFLFRGLETVLSSDLALQTAKCLWFLYKRVELLESDKILPNLIDLLLQRLFSMLLFHWSWLVRKCFMSFMLYKICEQARRVAASRSGSSGPGKPLGVTDRLYCWAYIQISRNLEALDLPQVLPVRFIDVNLRKLLRESPTVPPPTGSLTGSRSTAANGGLRTDHSSCATGLKYHTYSTYQPLAGPLAPPFDGIVDDSAANSSSAAAIHHPPNGSFRSLRLGELSRILPEASAGSSTQVHSERTTTSSRSPAMVPSSPNSHRRPTSYCVSSHNKVKDSPPSRGGHEMVTSVGESTATGPALSIRGAASGFASMGRHVLSYRHGLKRLSRRTLRSSTNEKGADNDSVAVGATNDHYSYDNSHYDGFITHPDHAPTGATIGGTVPPHNCSLSVNDADRNGRASVGDEETCNTGRVRQIVDPYDFLPPLISPSPRAGPYIKAAAREFAQELAAYKGWVISGKTEVPPMHIPASPLDTNVEVPIDDD